MSLRPAVNRSVDETTQGKIAGLIPSGALQAQGDMPTVRDHLRR
jgi:hypothetical protein